MRLKLACQEGMVPGKSLEEKFENLEEYGYEGIDLGGNLQERQDEIVKATSASAVKLGITGASYQGRLLSEDRKQRELAISGIKNCLKIAANIKAVGVFIVVGPSEPPFPDLSPYKTTRELEKELLVTLLKELGDYAQKVGSLLLIEPCNRYEIPWLNRLEEAAEICKEVGSPSVGILPDFFHMNIEERDIAQSIKAAFKYIHHIHLVDSTRLLPGYGHTDFEPAFAALKEIGYDGYLSLEAGIPGKAEEELPKVVEYLKPWL